MQTLNSLSTGALRCLVIWLVSMCGCNTANQKRPEAAIGKPIESTWLRPEVFLLPLVVPPSTLGSPWTPDALSGKELNEFLDTALPPASKVPAGKSLRDVVEEASGKTVVWERIADKDPFARSRRVEETPFQQRFPNTPHPTFRDAISVFLAIANQDRINLPTDPDYDYRNFVLVTRWHIILISLPVGTANGSPLHEKLPRIVPQNLEK